MTENNNLSERAKSFKRGLALISEDNVRNFCIELLNNADDYFFTEPASSSGKYHPLYALGDGGLMRHSIAVAIFIRHILDCDMFQDGENKFTEHEKSLLVCGAIVHDIKKYGKVNSGHTVKEHPELAAEYIMESDYKKFGLTEEDAKFMASAVSAHMGQWGKTKPQTNAQKILHIADYLASRKDLSLDFDNIQTPRFETTKVKPSINENTNPGEYIITFGKHRDKTISQIAKIDMPYLQWISEKFANPEHEAVIMTKKYLNK